MNTIVTLLNTHLRALHQSSKRNDARSYNMTRYTLRFDKERVCNIHNMYMYDV